jgi:EAL domain-containing protein (putative c-di-GMP-specific phosphodiesterase class I)
MYHVFITLPDSRRVGILTKSGSMQTHRRSNQATSDGVLTVPNLIHLIYCSAARKSFRPEELGRLLARARRHNADNGITGMLLYAEGSFFQVLEGEAEVIDRLFAIIARDKRHRDITVIIREPIARREFGDWSMGYASITPGDMGSIFGEDEPDPLPRASLDGLPEGRARKLLAAFRRGRWRTKLSDEDNAILPRVPPPPVGRRLTGPVMDKPPAVSAQISFAFQPIVDIAAKAIVSYEALLRGANNEPVEHVLESVIPAELPVLNEQVPLMALDLAARLGLSTRLNLNMMPRTIAAFPSVITGLLAAADRCGIRPERIVLEILEREMIDDFDGFRAVTSKYRRSGLIFAIDDFGAGYAGLNLLAEFQPHLIKLDMNLIRGVESRGPRQAIIRGIARTCFDLGIDIIAEGVETPEEFAWLRQEGIHLFQGYLFARPAFEELPRTCCLPP